MGEDGEAVKVVAFLKIPVSLAMAGAARSQQHGLENRIGDRIVCRILVVIDSNASAHSQAKMAVVDAQEILDFSRPNLRAWLIIIQIAISMASCAFNLAFSDLDNTHRHFIIHSGTFRTDRQSKPKLPVGRPVPAQNRNFTVDPLEFFINDEFLLDQAAWELLLQAEDFLDRP